MKMLWHFVIVIEFELDWTGLEICRRGTGDGVDQPAARVESTVDICKGNDTCEPPPPSPRLPNGIRNTVDTAAATAGCRRLDAGKKKRKTLAGVNIPPTPCRKSAGLMRVNWSYSFRCRVSGQFISSDASRIRGKSGLCLSMPHPVCPFVEPFFVTYIPLLIDIPVLLHAPV